jgi:hypothetical protein
MNGNGHQATVRFAQDGAVGTVTLNSPPLNLIDQQLISDLVAAFSQVEAAKGLRALVLRGEGNVLIHRPGPQDRTAAVPDSRGGARDLHGRRV